MYVTAKGICTKATVVEGTKPCCDPKQDKSRAHKAAAMDSCFGLVRPHQHSTASKRAKRVKSYVYKYRRN